MKELSIEEKAKAYDNALEIAKGLYAKDAPDSLHLERMFPQLKESEDERIRKSLIDMLKNDEKHYLKEIAWLEKQGEQKQETSYLKFDFDDILALQCCMETAEKVTEDKELYKKLQNLHSRLHDAYWLEKQGEQKQDPCEHCNDRRLNCHNFPCTKKKAFEQGKSALEVINEEKVDNANKVEPKFKDGDVLNSPSHHLVWIYKDNDHHHACVNMNYVTGNVTTDGLISIPNDACPATNDERTILLSNLEKSGYEWNAEKKELEIIDRRKHIKYEPNSPSIIKEKTGWSEEDEKMLDSIIEEVRYIGDFPDYPTEEENELYDECLAKVNWLKSLKERVQPQPKQEWSKEDEKKRNLLIDILNVNHPNGRFKVNPANTLNMEAMSKEELVDWLKSLQPQNTWKPSDEQIEVFEHFVRSIGESGYSSPYENNTKLLYSLLEDLKKLK